MQCIGVYMNPYMKYNKQWNDEDYYTVMGYNVECSHVLLSH